jgi:hypothetical protein
VTARKAQEPIAAATFSEIEGHGSLGVGPGPGGDGEVEKPRTDVTRVDGLAEVHVDVGNLGLLENG